MRHVKTAALVSLLALVSILATGGVATATDVSSDLDDKTCSTGTAGSFDFEDHGEVVTVSDACPNGWGTVVELWWSAGKESPVRLHRACWDRDGANGEPRRCNFSIPDGREISFYIADANQRTRNCERPPEGTRPTGNYFTYPKYPTTGATATGCKRRGHWKKATETGKA